MPRRAKGNRPRRISGRLLLVLCLFAVPNLLLSARPSPAEAGTAAAGFMGPNDEWFCVWISREELLLDPPGLKITWHLECTDTRTSETYTCDEPDGALDFWDCYPSGPKPGTSGGAAAIRAWIEQEPAPEDIPQKPGGWPPPVITPPVQPADGCSASWQVTVPQSSSGPTNLRFEYGDGQSAPLNTIPQGASTSTFSYSHEFSACATGVTGDGGLTPIQKASVVTTYGALVVGSTALAVTVIRSPAPSGAKTLPYPLECPVGYMGFTSTSGTRANGCKGGILEPYYASTTTSEADSDVDQSEPLIPSSQGGVNCGDTIVGSVALASDVGPCTDDGLKMSDNAVLDLNGYKVLGATAGSGETQQGLPNVDDAGILFSGVSGAKVTDSTARNVDGSWVATNAVTGFDAGVAIILGASGNTVEKLTIVGNVGMDGDYGDGVLIRNSESNSIVNNVVAANGSHGGISLVDNSDYNLVADNIVMANRSVPLTFTGQPLEPNAIGIRLEASDAAAPCPDNNRIINNAVSGNDLDGISILNGFACDSTNNELADNTVTGNARDGIRLNGRYFPSIGGERGSFGTQVHDNVVCENGGAGIRVTHSVRNSVITKNVVGFPAPCGANNPAIVGTWFPYIPPLADLHDGNFECAGNVWTDNSHLTESAGVGSSTAALPTDYVCLR